MTVRSPWYYVALVPPGRNAEPVDLTNSVLSFDFEDDERKTDKLRITVNNFDLSNFDDPLWQHGAILRVGFGNGVEQAPIREMVIKKVTGGRVLNIEANDRAVEMDTVRKRRVFENKTRSEVIRILAEENGYDDPDIEDTEERFEVLNQGNLSDAQFMRKLAHLEGFQFFVDFDGLHWHRRRVGQAPIRTLTYYADNPAAGGDILDFNVENDITRKPGRVRVSGRDPIEQKEFTVEVDNESDTGREVMQKFLGVPQPEPQKAEQGKESAKRGYLGGESGDLTLKNVAVEHTVASNVQTAEDAEREAQAKYRLATQRAVKMTLKIRGAPGLLAKSVVNVSGLGKRLSGKYYVKSVKHPLSGSSGYVSTVKVITDGFQQGFGSNTGEGGDPSAVIASCVEELRGVRSFLFGVSDFEVQLASQLDTTIPKLAQLASFSGSKLAQGARQAANKLSAIAQAAKSNNASSVFEVAANCAGTLRRLAEATPADEAAGQVNTKDESDADARQAVEVVDGETGETSTKYVNKRGRDA